MTETTNGARYEVAKAPARGSTDPCVHPRPSLTRAAWQSLDGKWSFSRSHDLTARAPALDDQILVPYAPESPASGIGGVTDHRVFWYSRVLELPEEWRGKRVWLRFNAVDWAATVWVAGHKVTDHEGGYSPFGIDVTEHVSGGPVELVVRCVDDHSDMAQPRGKQDWLPQPHSIWYPRTSGIWQSVWWEAVDEVHVDSLLITADLTTFSLDFDVRLNGLSFAAGLEPGVRARVRVTHEGQLLVDDEFGVVGAAVRRRVYLHDPGIDDARARLLWWPERPNLLDVEIVVTRGEVVLDTVHAATAMRTIETRDGAVLLNGRPYTLRMALDQGYWPETHLTPPDSDALRRDVELAKQLGFNGVRKHQKLEDPRFYAWADRLGLLVWVELPSAYTFDSRALGRLIATWQAAVAQAAPHASVMAWVPFNESWGVPDLPTSAAQRALVRGLAELTRALDPTRPVVGNDGWEILSTDLVNVHDYSSNPEDLASRYGTRAATAASLADVQPAGRRLLLEDRDAEGLPVLLSEFGGVRIEDGAPGWGYTAVPDSAAFLDRYQALLNVVVGATRTGALAGFCYTQLTDTFQERNGLLSMDRVPKADLAALARATRGEGGG
ncbi:MAG TPA: glycoside hydrolase family 2 TIM barrel-domain containing protein [Trueperaceae bacterium]|nr:glycoside hydrolase family 2 TIM barrel-domain containing protein [Trueperaceae bacterium]